MAICAAMMIVIATPCARRKTRSIRPAHRARRHRTAGTSASEPTAPGFRRRAAERRREGEAGLRRQVRRPATATRERAAPNDRARRRRSEPGSRQARPPLRTVGSYWPYATTLFDYVRRAMPFQRHRNRCTNDELYAVSAYILRSQRHPRALTTRSMRSRCPKL